MSLVSRDKKHIWHPLNQHQTHPNSLPIVKAKGIYLYDEKGNKYIDGISSWYTSVYGHCNPTITDAVKKQMDQLDQIVFAGFTHEPAIELSERLIEILPNNQKKIFFSDNGSTAVEVGIKMALQYWSNKGIDKTKIIGFNEGFHGDTFGAMAASGESVYNKPFKPLMVSSTKILPPRKNNIEYVLEHLEKLTKANDVAALVYEPLVQGAAGMKMHDEEALEQVLSFCRTKGVLLIADEVMTGFGKTGTYFASDRMKTKPDIICMSKALSAGLLPLAATSSTQDIYDAFLSDKNEKSFFHAHTYSANPLACVAAIEGIKLLTSSYIQDQIKMIEECNHDFLEALKNVDKVTNLRQKGVILAFDIKTKNNHVYGTLRDTLFNYFINKGLYLRPLGNTLYIVPPYVITKVELKHVHQTLLEGIKSLSIDE